jgi:hypothetical protein
MNKEDVKKILKASGIHSGLSFDEEISDSEADDLAQQICDLDSQPASEGLQKQLARELCRWFPFGKYTIWENLTTEKRVKYLFYAQEIIDRTQKVASQQAFKEVLTELEKCLPSKDKRPRKYCTECIVGLINKLKSGHLPKE